MVDFLEKKDVFKPDTKDWRILNSIIFDSRESVSKIAKECLISRNSAEYRINRMKENGLITGFKSVINIEKLGYKKFHVFLMMNSTNDEKMFLDRIVASPDVNSIMSYKGKFNYEISIIAKDLNVFLDIYHSLIKDISISSEEMLILLTNVKGVVLPKKFFKKDVDVSVQNVIKKKFIDYNIDEVDFNLMKILSADASLSYIELAERLKVSIDVVRYKFKKLIDSGYILEFRPAIDYSVLNLSVKTILLKLNSYYYDSHLSFESFLREDDSVLWCTSTFGGYNYIVYVLTENVEELHEFFDKIKDKFGYIIKTYELLLAHKQYKYQFMSDSIKIK